MKTALLALSLSTLAACAATPKAAPLKPTQATVSALEQPDGDDRSTYHVVRLEYAESHDLAKVLMNAVRRRSNQTIVADPRTNSLVITCTADEFAAIRKLIAELDVPAEKRG